jgi:endonuclease YncB( thermonuclease family)
MLRNLLLALFLLGWVWPSWVVAAELRIVIRVISGDTIIVDGGQAVKLIGVVAASGDDEHAKAAQQAVTTLLLGQEVDLLNDNRNLATGHKDPYGRRLAYVYRAKDQLFVNLTLLQQGLVFYSSKYTQRSASQFLVDQQRARTERRGLWVKYTTSPEEQARAEKRPYDEPKFEYRENYKSPDLRVEILWAKKADPRFRVGRSIEEAKFLEKLYQDEEVNAGKLPLLVKLRQGFAAQLTKFYQEQGIPLKIEALGEMADSLRFSAPGMDQKDADQFCQIPFNRELFAGLEFLTVLFTDGQQFSYTYKVAPQ